MCSVVLRSILSDLMSCTRLGVSSHHYYTKLRKRSQFPYHTNMEGKEWLCSTVPRIYFVVIHFCLHCSISPSNVFLLEFRALIVTLMPASTSALVSALDFLVNIYVINKGLSGELSSRWTVLLLYHLIYQTPRSVFLKVPSIALSDFDFNIKHTCF